MKILYVTDIYPLISQVFITREILALESEGVDIKILSILRPNDSINHSIDKERKAEVIYGDSIYSGKIIKGFQHLRFLLTNFRNYLKTICVIKTPGLPGLNYKFTQTPLIYNRVKTFKPDLIHCHLGREGFITGWLLSKFMDIPLSVTLHGSDILVDPYENIGLLLNDTMRIVCISNMIRDTVNNHVCTDFLDNLYMIRCGIDTEQFYPKKFPPGNLKILTVARLHKIKGLKILIKACYFLKQNEISFECNIYGEGDERKSLENLIDKLGLYPEVILHGAIENEKLPGVYSDHSLFVLPSFSEGAGVVIMEAMASGLPIVASNVGGIPELVENDVNGFLVNHGDPELLSNAIMRFINLSNSDIDRMRELNQKKIESNFYSVNEIEKLHKMFIELIDHKTRA